jgi:benzoyl-CoA reductase/2-hydroxyglutaryl-CoA dehydratase subunit BcrC/BadD/HgdB
VNHGGSDYSYEEPRQIAFDEWDRRYAELKAAGVRGPGYSGPLRRHLEAGDLRLPKLRYDNSAAALRLWNFLLSEEDRLHEARARGRKIVGTMKDLGTAAVMAYSLDNVVAFYPDGAWWIPCVMELSAGATRIADSLGIDESFCPVRAMLGAFLNEEHFPVPDLLTCSVGATCDDFSSLAQRLNGLGFPILWWEIPHRRYPEPGEETVSLPGGFAAPASQVVFVKSELERVRTAMEVLTAQRLDDARLAAGIKRANQVRRCLSELRTLNFTAPLCPMPALEMLVAEMLAIHFCSDRDECIVVLGELLDESRRRARAGMGHFSPEAVRVFWVNPVADIRVMNLLEECGGRICGTDYLFCHALDVIPEDSPPMEALARMALADPMVGSAADRADRICRDIRTFGTQALVISRIPGASHCAIEGAIIADVVRSRLGIPVVEIEAPPVTDAMQPTIRTRLEALIETVRGRVRHKS